MVPDRIRRELRRIHKAVHGEYWLPHVPLAVAMVLSGLWLLRTSVGENWDTRLLGIVTGSQELTPTIFPPLVLGLGMLGTSVGLAMRSRIAWVMGLLLSLAAAGMIVVNSTVTSGAIPWFVVLLVVLALTRDVFDRSSVAASTLFAFTSMAMLLLYAMLGGLYFGQSFDPPINSMTNALYYAIVTMSTVGFGDITPTDGDAQLFTASVIVLGVAVFATSLTAVFAPIVTRSMQRIVTPKTKPMKRENHFVVVGNSPLALNTVSELKARGLPVTRVFPSTPADGVADSIDHVVGEPSAVSTLTEAGVSDARAVLAMMEDDSENAFIILAVNELGSEARTIAAVHDASHMARVRLVQPDVVISPQVLGGELLAMMLSGEEVTADFIMKRLFHED